MNKLVLIAALCLTVVANATGNAIDWVNRWSQTSTYEWGKNKIVTEQVMVRNNYSDSPSYLTRMTTYYDSVPIDVSVHFNSFSTPIQNQNWTWVSPDGNTRNSVTGRTQIRLKSMSSFMIFKRINIFGDNLFSNGQPMGTTHNAQAVLYINPYDVVTSHSPWCSYENFNNGYYSILDW